jgi:hypothetical protein
MAAKTKPSKPNGLEMKAYKSLDTYIKSLSKNQTLLKEIMEQASQRTKADIQRWRYALDAAENMTQPRRTNLIKIYDEIWLDGHIRGIVENVLQEGVKSKPFQIVDVKKKENIDATDFFNSQWFYEIIDHIIDARFWGHSLVDIRVKNGKVHQYLVPRVHVEPIYGQLLKNQNDWEGPKYREEFKGYFIEAGKDRDLGLLNPMVPYALFKKNAFVAWSEYCDIFGMPFRSAYTSSSLKKDHDRLATSLMEMGKAGWGVFMKGIEEFKIEDSGGQGSGAGNTVYDQLAEASDRQMSKLLLGNTLTTDSGKNGSRAHAEQHKDVTDDVISALMRSVQFVVNDQLIPVLISQGFTWLEGHKFVYPIQKNKDQIVKHLDVLMKYKDVPDEWIEQHIGIPVSPKKAQDKQQEDPETKKQQKPNGTKARDAGKKKDEIMAMHMKLQKIYKPHSH